MTTTETTQVIHCPCDTYGDPMTGDRSRARVRGAKALTPTMVHNLVHQAWSPFFRAESACKFGPWAICPAHEEGDEACGELDLCPPAKRFRD